MGYRSRAESMAEAVREKLARLDLRHLLLSSSAGECWVRCSYHEYGFA